MNKQTELPYNGIVISLEGYFGITEREPEIYDKVFIEDEYFNESQQRQYYRCYSCTPPTGGMLMFPVESIKKLDKIIDPFIPKRKYEYSIKTLEFCRYNEKYLDEMGEKGWDLVHVYYPKLTSQVELTFKREI